jgi:hypothetical protein
MSESNTKVQKDAENPAKGTKHQSKKGDSKGHQESGKVKLTAPELPGSMKFMLMDEKDEDANLKAIRITFYRRNVTESEFQVPDPVTEKLVWLRPAEYDAYKEAYRAKKKKTREAEAGHGWAKKLAHRALIFVKAGSDDEFIKLMNHKPVPKQVVGMMSLAQQEFTAKFPTPDSVLDYWLSINNPDEREMISSYAKALGCDFPETLGSMNGLRKLRAEKKSEKTSKAVANAATKAKDKDLVPPGMSWGESESKNDGKAAPVVVVQQKAPDPKEKLVDAILLIYTGEELSRPERMRLDVDMLSILPDASFEELTDAVAVRYLDDKQGPPDRNELITLTEKFLISRKPDQKG